MTKVIHLSVVHFPYDPRVVYREAFSIAKRYETYLLIPNADDSIHDNLRFVSLPYYPKLLKRLFFSHPVAFWKCLRIGAKVIHFHNAELLPVAFLLWLLGRKIIYDVHENVRKQWSAKAFNNNLVFRVFFKLFDTIAQRRFHIIMAEWSYQQTYQHLVKPSEVILNYPDIAFFQPYKKEKNVTFNQPIEVFYIGQISLARGMDTLIRALVRLDTIRPDFVVHLVGGFEFDIIDEQVFEKIEGYHKVKDRIRFYGKIDAREGLKYAKNATVGFALLKPVGDFPESYPTKVFEYMALGLPFITSDFELYRPIVEQHQCGFCIDPNSDEILAEKILWLANNPIEANEMAVRGMVAVERYYNWQSEEQKLFRFYEQVISK
jgi:glycosyltransferase involved in cell wall biosynthesis